ISCDTGLHHAGKRKIRMVKDIKELTFKPQLHMLGQGKPFCQVEVTPEEIGTTQGIAAEGSGLAMLRAVAAVALPCTRINRRYKCVRIEPLKSSRRRYTRNRMMLIQRNAGNNTSKLRPAALHNSLFLQGALTDLNRACSTPRTELRCAKTQFRKSASQAREAFETSSLAPHQGCFTKRSDAEFMQ